MYDVIAKSLKENNRIVDQITVKVVVFRDLYVDEEKGIEESQIYKLPEESAEYKHFLDQITAAGGGSRAESGLEALAYGLQKAVWSKRYSKHRQLVMLYSDDEAHPFEKSQKGTDKFYPKGMPHSLSEFSDWIEHSKQSPLASTGIRPKDFRVFLFTPPVYPYDQMSSWTGFILIPQKQGAGLNNLDYNIITSAICGSF